MKKTCFCCSVPAWMVGPISQIRRRSPGSGRSGTAAAMNSSARMNCSSGPKSGAAVFPRPGHGQQTLPRHKLAHP